MSIPGMQNPVGKHLHRLIMLDPASGNHHGALKRLLSDREAFERKKSQVQHTE